VSLVHENLIAVLNRRFVSTYYNAFSTGIGADEEAAAFVKGAKGLAAIGGARYGLLMTPEDEALVSFGYARDEFVRSLKKVLAEQPAYMTPTVMERAVFQAAKAKDASAAAHLAAARLDAELLDDADARRQIEQALAAHPDAATRQRTLYLRGHLAAVDLEHRDPAACRADFAAMGDDLPADLADDVLCDLISLDVRLRPARGFYTGWEFQPGTDLEKYTAILERWIASAPESNRIGQMHFFLGLARSGLGDRAGADAIWKKHVETWPEDRFAMLSHIHHSGYKFSPTKTGGKSVVTSMGGLANDPAQIRRLLKALERGRGGVSIQGGGPGAKAALIQRLRKMLEAAERKQGAKKTDDDEP